MRYSITIAFVLIIALGATANASINLTSFLQCPEPEKMCQNYISGTYGNEIVTLVNPRGGATIRFNEGPTQDYCVSIFCDPSLNGLVLFHYYDQYGGHTPRRITKYGLEPPFALEPDSFSIHYIDTLTPPDNFESIFIPRDSIGEFYQPVDVAASLNGEYFDPDSDYVYVVDQGNHRIVKLHYYHNYDSLVWAGTFGEEVLVYPTAIAYADYGGHDRADHDIYVTDAGQAKIFRFSAAGVYEADYGGFGTGLSLMGYPTGIAVIPADNYAEYIYISDSHNYNVARFISETTNEIYADKLFYVPFTPLPFLSALDVDAWGDVYVVDSYNHKIIVLNDDIDTILAEYGSQGTDPGQFESPVDIYIDRRDNPNEMVICEWWDEYSGIQCFTVDKNFGKKAVRSGVLPDKFELYANYPNPFNSSTTINFDLPISSRVIIDIYNILGQRVTRLADKPFQAGHHQINWNASSVASGVYFYRLSAGDKVFVKKMLLLK